MNHLTHSGFGRWLMAIVLLSSSAVATAAGQDIRPWTGGEKPFQSHIKPGTWTLVMFWSVTCSICASETPTLNSYYQAERDNGVHLLGVSIDGAAMKDVVGEWMERYQMGFPTLLGDLGPIAAFFGESTKEAFRGTPTFMIFNRSGELVGVNAGPVRVQALKDFIARKESGG